MCIYTRKVDEYKFIGIEMKKILFFLVFFSVQLSSVANAQIFNWHSVSAKSQKNGGDTSDIFIFDISYFKDLPGEKDSCRVIITEIRNTNCLSNNSAYIEKPRVMTNNDGLSCNIVRKSKKFEQAVISYVTNMETTLITLGYDRKIQEVVEFEGSTEFSFPNNEFLKIRYLPLKSKKGFADGVISCGKISLRTMVGD